MTVPIQHPGQEAADQLAAGLRALAYFVGANPHLYPYLQYSGLTHEINIPVASEEQPREAVAAFARAGLRAGCKVPKRIGEKWAGVTVEFGGGIGLYVYAERGQVCERVVVGTEEVTEEVPDPAALAAVPTTTVTKTVEKVEWVCKPLLGEAGA
jgi:hypothetical protein